MKARPDFAKISAKRVGKYPVFVGAGAKAALGTATSVPDKAKAFVTNWLKEAYGVSLIEEVTSLSPRAPTERRREVPPI